MEGILLVKIVEKYQKLKCLHWRNLKKQFSHTYVAVICWQNMQLRFQITIDTASLQVIWSVKFQRYQHTYRSGRLPLSSQIYWEISEIYYICCFILVFNVMLQLTHIFWTFLTVVFTGFCSLCGPLLRQSWIFILTQLSLFAFCFLMSTIYKVRIGFSNWHYRLFMLRINLI
jgi:hypothetical protein